MINTFIIKINSILPKFKFNILFICRKSTFCLSYHIYIGQNNFWTNFNIKYSFSLLLEVHLQYGTVSTSANFKMRVLTPILTGKEYVIYEYVCLSYIYNSFSKVNLYLKCITSSLNWLLHYFHGMTHQLMIHSRIIYQQHI